MALKECAKCGGIFEAEVFFHRNILRYAYRKSGRHPICIGCEQSARDEAKAIDRWPAKIRATINLHARRLHTTAIALAQEFGWNPGRMIHDAKHAYENGCCYCGQRFKEMGHGLNDLTLDIVNPTDPPFYYTNVRWACMTCNREKSRTPAALWGAKLAAWEMWRRLPKGPRQRKLF
jgi:hypothetical protein